MTKTVCIVSVLSLAFFLSGASAQQKNTVWDDSLAQLLQECRNRQIPTEQLENKIFEGHAKKRSSRDIYLAVKNRRTLLLQVRENNGGVLPETYTNRLFELEKREVPTDTVRDNKIMVHSKRVQRHSRDTSSSAVTADRHVRDVENDTTSMEKPAKPSKSAAQQDKHEQKALEKLQKAEAHSEKMAQKASERAEKRMDKIQKRIEKRAMKRNGAD